MGVPFIKIDQERQEPYVPLEAYPELRLTPARREDAEDHARLFNDPSVGRYAYRRPYPYSLDQAKEWIEANWERDQKSIKEIIDALTKGGVPSPKFFPLSALRYVPTAEGSGSLHSKLEEAGIKPGQFVGKFYLCPSDRNGISAEEMVLRIPKEQTWEIAYDLFPILQGRGIGTAMIKSGLETWLGWLGVQTVEAYIQTDNIPSQKVVAKCGLTEVQRQTWEWPADKGGGDRDMIRFARTGPFEYSG